MKKHYFLLLFSFISLLANAQISSDIDPDFDCKDKLPILNLLSPDFALQSDGKLILIGGQYSYKLYNNKQETIGNNILRLNKDLTIDNSFQTGLGFDSTVNNIVIQPDGKIVVCGLFKSYNGTAVNKIVRLNQDGSIDNTFNFTNPGFSIFSITQIDFVKLQPNGKILIAGKFEATIYGNFYGRNALRLNSDGSIDRTFQSDYPYEIFKIELQPDGKILRVYKNTYNKESSYKIDRINTNGTADQSFTAIEGFGRICSSNTVGYNSMSDCKLALQPDGKILFGACFTSFKSLDTRGFMRFNSDGTKDSSFEYVVPGFPMATVKDFILLPNNKILTNNLTLINSDGSIDNTAPIKLDVNSTSNKILLYPNNELLVCSLNTINFPGGLSTFNKFIKLNLTTSEVNTQQLNTFYAGNDILEKPNGDIVILGYSKNTYNTKYHDGIKLLNKNGNLIFNNNLKSNLFSTTQNEQNYFKQGIVQPDGKIIVFKITAGKDSGLVRYNDDFTIDNSFVKTVAGDVNTLLLQPNGKILVISNSQQKIIRLNSDGSKDNTFADTSGFDNVCYTAALQPDGKIILGGNFSFYNEIKTNRLARFNADGTFDNTFNADQALLRGFVYSLGIQSDGKIIVGGSFELNQEGKNSVLKRLNTDGSIDNTFTEYFASSIPMYTKRLVIQPDNKIILSTTLNRDPNEYAKNDFQRLESNGKIDNTFDSGDAFDANINAIKFQKDGSLLVTGNFTKYKNTWSNGSVRLLAYKGTLSKPDFLFGSNEDNFILFPNPVKNVLNITSNEDVAIKSIQIYNILGQSALELKNKKTFSNVDVSSLNNGVYFIRINSNKGTATHKFLKN